MPPERRDTGADRPLRYEEIADHEFQKKWLEARDLSWDQVDLAFRHGFDARERFAERPFPEVADYLRHSWEAMGAQPAWEQVQDIVCSGYERYKGAGFGPSVEEVSEALEHFPTRTIGGSTIGGVMGERFLLGAAEPVSDFPGESGPPVGGEQGAAEPTERRRLNE